MKFLVPNYSCLRYPRLGAYLPQIPVLSFLCPQLNLLIPPPRTKFLDSPLNILLKKKGVYEVSILLQNEWKKRLRKNRK